MRLPMAPIPMKPRRGLDCWLSVVIVIVTPPRSGSCAGKECLDCCEFPGAEAELSRPGQATHLFGTPRADNGTGHGGIAQHPGDRHFARRAPVLVTDGPQQSHESQVAGYLRLAQ